VLDWRPKSTTAARSEIDAQEKFISFFKVGVLTRVMSGRDTASLETGAGAKAANSSVDDLSLVIRELDKKAQGEYSLRLLLAATAPSSYATPRERASDLRRCAGAGDRRRLAISAPSMRCSLAMESSISFRCAQ